MLLADAAAIDLHGLSDDARPVGVVAGVGVMVTWTAFTAWAYVDRRRRTPLLLGADLVLAVVLVLATPLVKGEEFFATVPGFWVAGATLAWSVQYRWLGGLVAGVVVAVADLSVRSGLDQVNTGNLFLLVVSGPIVGFMVESLVRVTAARDAAERAAAAASERARLARVVHDGVLQVLALAQRRGGEAGGDAELGRLAGEQERALRTLVVEQRAAGPVPVGAADLVAALVPLGARPAVDVVTPGGAVLLPGPVVAELAAAVRACVDNVARHAGPAARAWVYVEDTGDRVVVSVRDDGPGIAPGRLAEAAGQGRLGVTQSIRGRLADLGGTATLHTAADGTEWELVIPREDES